MSKKEPVYTFQRPRSNNSNKQSKLYGSDVTTSTAGLAGRGGGNSIENYESNKTALDYIKDTAYYQKWTLYMIILILAILVMCIICVKIKGVPVKIKG
jgi:hypothetical protein